MTRPIDALASLVDRLRAVRRLRRVSSLRAVNRFADAVYHAQLVEESMQFVTRELRGRSRRALYRPRGRSLVAEIRHRTGDLYVLNEIVRHGEYRFPGEAERRLDALGRPPRVVDVGANIGLFGIEVFDRFPGATVTAFEPDPANAYVHEAAVRANGLQRHWHVIRSCAGTADGTVRFAAEGHVGSRIDSSPGATSVPIADVFPYLQQADLVKMDIEGSEWPILADPRLRELNDLVVVLEYHHDGCPYPDAREAALRFLSDAGFATREVGASRRPDGTGVVWGWK